MLRISVRSQEVLNNTGIDALAGNSVRRPVDRLTYQDEMRVPRYELLPNWSCFTYFIGKR